MKKLIERLEEAVSAERALASADKSWSKGRKSLNSQHKTDQAHGIQSILVGVYDYVNFVLGDKGLAKKIWNLAQEFEAAKKEYRKTEG